MQHYGPHNSHAFEDACSSSQSADFSFRWMRFHRKYFCRRRCCAALPYSTLLYSQNMCFFKTWGAYMQCSLCSMSQEGTTDLVFSGHSLSINWMLRTYPSWIIHRMLWDQWHHGKERFSQAWKRGTFGHACCRSAPFRAPGKVASRRLAINARPSHFLTNNRVKTFLLFFKNFP